MAQVIRQSNESGSAAGVPFNDAQDDVIRVKSIEVSRFIWLTSIRVTYALKDGQQRTVEHGRRGAIDQIFEVSFAEDEVLHTVEVGLRDGLAGLPGLIFHTNKRRIEVTGPEVASTEEIGAKDGAVIAFFGHVHENAITGFGVLYEGTTQSKDRVIHMSNEAGHATGGRFTDNRDDISRLHSVEVSRLIWVTSIRTTYDLADGTQRTIEHGHRGGADQVVKVVLPEHEFIRSVRVGRTFDRLAGLIFETNERRIEATGPEVGSYEEVSAGEFPALGFFGHMDDKGITGLGLLHAESTRTRVALFNQTKFLVNNSIFAYLVPPGVNIGAGVGDVFPVSDRARFPQLFGSIDRNEISGRIDVDVGTWQVYITWDDVGASKYKITGIGSVALVPFAPGRTTANLIVYTEVDGNGNVSHTFLQ